MVVVGLAASIAAVPTNIAVVGFVIGWVAASEKDPEPWPPKDLPVREIVIVWAICTPITIIGLRSGLRLLRGRLEERVAQLLDGRDVIAYTTDRRGRRRFARALRGALMSLHSAGW